MREASIIRTSCLGRAVCAQISGHLGSHTNVQSVTAAYTTNYRSVMAYQKLMSRLQSGGFLGFYSDGKPALATVSVCLCPFLGGAQKCCFQACCQTVALRRLESSPHKAQKGPCQQVHNLAVSAKKSTCPCCMDNGSNFLREDKNSQQTSTPRCKRQNCKPQSSLVRVLQIPARADKGCSSCPQLGTAPLARLAGRSKKQNLQFWILKSKVLDCRTLRWIYFLDMVRGLGSGSSGLTTSSVLPIRQAAEGRLDLFLLGRRAGSTNFSICAIHLYLYNIYIYILGSWLKLKAEGLMYARNTYFGAWSM